MAVAAAALTFGLGPVASHAHEFAEWVVQSLVPWLVVLAVSLYISLLRATLRCPVRVYVGNDPKIRRVSAQPAFNYMLNIGMVWWCWSPNAPHDSLGISPGCDKVPIIPERLSPTRVGSRGVGTSCALSVPQLAESAPKGPYP